MCIKWIVKWVGDFKTQKKPATCCMSLSQSFGHRQHQLLIACLYVKDKCTKGKFWTTNHKIIMEHLRLQGDQFRRQGRLKDDKMETIIKELKKDMEIDGGWGQDRNQQGPMNT
jgi:hypothetical protein